MNRLHATIVGSAAHVRRRRTRAASDQSGYLLLYVLGVIGLTSVLVIALLGLALTSARVAAMEARLARDSRAADGALEAQIADLASRGGDVCGDASTWPRTVAASESGPEVEVTCDFGGVSDDPDADLAGPDVSVLGGGGAADDYQGGLQPAPSISGVAHPTVVVKGVDGPARFASDLFVRGGAAPERSAGSPAIDVAGQYEQGDAVGGSGCGALAAAGANRIDDAGGQGEPTCGSVRPITVAAPAATSAVPVVTGRAMTCPNVELDPGAYLPYDISRLNAILSGSNPCTVVFKPGVHYLDVFDSTRTGADRFVLTISNRNVKVIGGIPASPATFPNACVNVAGSAGVQILLSGRSAIRHSGGQVALCPDRTTGSALPVIQQSSSADSQPRFVGATSSSFANVANLDPSLPGWATTNVCGGTAPDDWYVWGDLWTGFTIYPRCWDRTFSSTWSSAGVGPLASAKVQLEMLQRPQNLAWGSFDDPGSFHNVDLGVRFKVSGSWGSCVTEDMKAGRAYAATLSYELRNNVAGNTCYGALTDQSQLNGSTVSATFFRFNNPGNGLVGLRLEVRNLRIETNSYTAVLAGTGAADSDWQQTPNAIVADNSSASVSQPANAGLTWVPGGGVWVTPGHTTSMTLTGITIPPGLNATDHLSRLGVTLRGPANQTSYVADPIDNGLTRVELVNAAGQTVCSTADDSTARAYTQANQYLRLDLIAPGNCAQLLTVGQLDGLNMKVTHRVGCAVLSFTGMPVYDAAGRCASVPLPKLDMVGLTIGTDTVTGRPPYSSVTANTSASTSFDAFGPVQLPLSDLDVHYTGTTSWPTGISRPTFEGPLQVHGLGVEQSGAETGVVCCVVGRDAAVLVARVDGQVRAQAAVRVNPAVVGHPNNRRPVEVLTWKLCSRVGC